MAHAKLDSMSLVTFLRKESCQPDTPPIMVTSNGQLQDVMNGIKAGVNDYVVKPINPEILTQKVKKNISNLTIVNTIAR